jgi:adenosine deaminase CECR1
VQSYEEARAALIATENSQAFDGQAVAAALAIEKRANELVGAIRKEDEKEIYGKLKDKDGRQRVVANHFLGNVDLINKTELLKVAKKMPKGAHLHCHFNSCLRPEFLLEQARG